MDHLQRRGLPLGYSRKRPIIAAFIWIGIVAWLIARMYLLVVRSFDPDEFEHLHAAYCVAKGMVPYRDFFEHHGPLPLYIAAILVRALGPTTQLLFANRILSYGFVALTLLGTYCLSRRLFGKWAGAPAVLWLITFHWFTGKSLEWRPDVPAMCLVTWSAYCAIRARKSNFRWDFIAGSLLGFAYLCTQKVIFASMGILVGMTVTARANHRPALASLISMGLGALMPIGICALLAIMHGALGDSFRCLVYYPLNWNTHAFYYGHLLGPIGGAPLQVGSALFGLFVLVPIAARARARWKRRAIAVPFMASLFHLAGLLLLPATYLQYYLIALPLLAALTMVIVPSIRISLRAGGRTDPTIAKAAVISCALAFLIDTILWATSYRRVTFENCDMASLGLLIIGGLLFLRHNNAAIAVCWFALLTPSLGRIAREFDIHNKNDGQKAKIRFINELVKENEFVLDGFSGVACLRPHAFYWWWINEHTIPIIVREGKLQALQRCVVDGKPALIVYDSELAKLNTLLVPAMTAGYRPTVRQPDQNSFLLLLRKDLVDLSDEGQAEVSNGDTAPSTEDRTVR